MKNYLVLIGDMVGSKAQRDRNSLQRSFAETLQKAQKKYGTAFISPLTLTIGDEFQAVLEKSDDLFSLLTFIETQLDGVQFRYGMGLGGIDTDINSQQAIGMDGPAFHRARAAIEQAKKEQRRFCFKSGHSGQEERINILLNWVDYAVKRWNAQRKKIFLYYCEQYTQKEIAARLRITQPAVSQNITAEIFQLTVRTVKLIQEEIGEMI